VNGEFYLRGNYRRQRARFAIESGDPIRIGSKLLREDLDRDVAF